MARAQAAPPPVAGIEAAPLHAWIQADRALRVAAAASGISDLHCWLEGLEVEGSVEGICFLVPLSEGWILIFCWSPPPPETFIERLLRPVGPAPRLTGARPHPPFQRAADPSARQPPVDGTAFVCLEEGVGPREGSGAEEALGRGVG